MKAPFVVDGTFRSTPSHVTGWTWAERAKAFSSVLPRASIIITGTPTGKDEVVRYYGINPANIESSKSRLRAMF